MGRVVGMSLLSRNGSCVLWVSSVDQLTGTDIKTQFRFSLPAWFHRGREKGSQNWIGNMSYFSSHHILGFGNCVGKCSAKWIGHLPCSDLDSELCRWVCEFAGGPSEVTKKWKERFFSGLIISTTLKLCFSSCDFTSKIIPNAVIKAFDLLAPCRFYLTANWLNVSHYMF